MLILGIDPGLATTGHGLIKHFPNRDLSLLDYGWIKTPKEMESGARLASIQKQLKAIIDQKKPDVISLEKLFFFANAKTAMMVSEAIGAIKLTSHQLGVPVFEYAPLRVKKLVTGNGRAQKAEMIKTIKQLLKMKTPLGKKTFFDDVCDALALAVCHAITITNPEPIVKKTKNKKEVKKIGKR